MSIVTPETTSQPPTGGYTWRSDRTPSALQHKSESERVAAMARSLGQAAVEILGGKVSRLRFCLRIVGSARSRGGSSLTLQAGGKPDGAQGVGTETRKVQEALEVARKFFETKMAS